MTEQRTQPMHLLLEGDETWDGRDVFQTKRTLTIQTACKYSAYIDEVGVCCTLSPQEPQSIHQRGPLQSAVDNRHKIQFEDRFDVRLSAAMDFL